MKLLRPALVALLLLVPATADAASRTVPFGPATTLTAERGWKPGIDDGSPLVEAGGGGVIVSARVGGRVLVATRPGNGPFGRPVTVEREVTGGDPAGAPFWVYGDDLRPRLVGLTPPADGYDERDVAVAASSGGRVDVAFVGSDDSAVTVATVSGAGDPRSQRVGENGMFPALAAGADGEAVVAWHDNWAPCGIGEHCRAVKLAVRPKDGAPFAPELMLDMLAPGLSGGDLDGPQLHEAGDRYVLSWRHTDPRIGLDALRVAVGRVGSAPGPVLTIPDTGVKLELRQACDAAAGPQPPAPFAETITDVVPRAGGAIDLLLRDAEHRCASGVRQARVAAGGAAVAAPAPVAQLRSAAEHEPWGYAASRGSALLVSHDDGRMLFAATDAGGAVRGTAGAIAGGELAAVEEVGGRALMLVTVPCGGGQRRTDVVVVEPSGAHRRAGVTGCRVGAPAIALDGRGRAVVAERGPRGALVARVSCPLVEWAAGGRRARCTPPRA